MAMTLLERLASETPCGGKIHIKNETLAPIRRLIHKHMAEIEEAQARGYSWTQIEEACRELWQSDKEASKIVWWKNKALVCSCYHALKSGYPLGKSKRRRFHPTTSKRFSVEVTEQ